mmetsp:Transcript_99526/g.281674  ORF Transcript_99526/g.281674 Transcript_99526/m.281674 type:complete len:268 (-) Transcript_99526:228-1031(-)
MHILLAPPYGDTSSQVSGFRDVMAGTTTLLEFSRNIDMICFVQPSAGFTWQSRKMITSPLLTSPPCFFERMSPSAMSCRKMRALRSTRSDSLMSRWMGGFDASSTTKISASSSAGVVSKTDRTVLITKSVSLAQGRTTEIVANDLEGGGGRSSSLSHHASCPGMRPFSRPGCAEPRSATPSSGTAGSRASLAAAALRTAPGPVASAGGASPDCRLSSQATCTSSTEAPIRRNTKGSLLHPIDRPVRNTMAASRPLQTRVAQTQKPSW